DTRSASRRGPDRAINDKDPIFLHLHRWKACLKITGVGPVSCDATTVQQTSFREDQRSRADRRNPSRLSRSIPYVCQQVWRKCRLSNKSSEHDQRIKVTFVKYLGFQG